MGLTHDDAHSGVWAPAATEFGWVMEHSCASMNLRRFTLHSLRDRSGNTVLRVWNSTGCCCFGEAPGRTPRYGDGFNLDL